MSKRKIIHITQSMGGVKSYILNILNNYDRNNFEHIIISSDKDFNKLVQSENYVKQVYFVPIKREPSFSDIQCLIKIRSILDLEKPYAVHVHSAKGGALGRLGCAFKKTKCIYTPHGFSYLSFKGTKRITFILIERFLKHFTYRLLAVSQSEANRALKEIGYHKEQIFVAPNSVNLPKIKKEDYELKMNIGMVGRLTHQKNPLEFIKLAMHFHTTQNKNVKFILLGGGFHDHLKPEIDCFIKKHSMDEYFEIKPWDDKSSMHLFYTELDLFILTSLFEGMPLSLLEAMSYGLPCIASNVDGNTDAITNGNTGILYSNFDELVKGTILLIKDIQLRRQIGINARRSISTSFNIKTRIRDIEKVYG